MKGPGRLGVSVVALVALAGLCAGGYAYHRHTTGEAHAAAGRPVLTAPPKRAPATEFAHRRICSEVRPAVTSAASQTSHGLVWVDSHPDGGVVVWHPGMNSTSCHAALTRLSTQQARSFAAAVDQAEAVPPGNYACAADDGSGATVYLDYPRRRLSEVVDVDLEGCRWIDAPGRAARRSISLRLLGREPAGLH